MAIYLLMSLQLGQDNGQWEKELHLYEKSRRTKKPFGKIQPLVEHSSREERIKKEHIYDPIKIQYQNQNEKHKAIQKEIQMLQQSQDRYLKNNYQYAENYDIINGALSQNPQQQTHPHALNYSNHSHTLNYSNISTRKKQFKEPTVSLHNVINGQKYGESYLQKKWLKVPKSYERKIHNMEDKSFNIINGRYPNNHEQQYASQLNQIDQHSLQKYQKSHIYDPVYARYYDPAREKSYAEDLNIKQKAHWKDYTEKIPISYRQRESYRQDVNEPLPEIVKRLDQKQFNAKKRYQMRHILDHEYKQRDQYLSEKKQIEALNRINNSRQIYNKARDLEHYSLNRYENINNSLNRYENINTGRNQSKQLNRSSTIDDCYPKKALIKNNGFETN